MRHSMGAQNSSASATGATENSTPLRGNALARLLQHLRGKVDADDLQIAFVGGKRQAGADPDLEDPALALVDDFHRMLAPFGRESVASVAGKSTEKITAVVRVILPFHGDLFAVVELRDATHT